MTDASSRKRARSGEEDWLARILTAPNLARIVLEYCSVNDLCAIDATRRSFRENTEPAWSKIAMEQFGIRNKERGKLAYRQGRALCRPRRHHVFNLQDPEEYGIVHAGSAKVVSNASIIVSGTDDSDTEGQVYTGENPLVFRDAKTLNLIRCRPSPSNCFGIAICGRQGCEVIVTSDYSSDVIAHQGDRTQRLNWEAIDSEQRGLVLPQNDDGVKLIGSEAHLIVIRSGKLNLFTPGADPLLHFVYSTPIIHNNPTTPQQHDAFSCHGLCWACEELPGMFAFSCLEGCISVWKTDVATSQAVQVLEIRSQASEVFGSIAVSERFVAGNPSRTKDIRIYDFESCEQLHELCDREESVESSDQEENFDDDDDEDPDDARFTYPLAMETVGDLLVSTSFFGMALCIWQMRTGTLLHRFDDAFRLHLADRLPEGVDVTSMSRLRAWNHTAFITMDWGLTVWAFPEDDHEDTMLKKLKRRETWLRRLRLASDDEDSSEGDY